MITEALCEKMSQAEAVAALAGIDAVYSYERPGSARGKKWYQLLPHIFRSNAPSFTVSGDSDGVLVRNIDELAYFRENPCKGELISDASLYSMNSEAREFLREQGVSAETLPYEISGRDIEERGARGSVLVIYGRVPLMISAQCLYITGRGRKCEKRKSGHTVKIKDRKGAEMEALSFCRYCYNVIYNSVPLLIEPEGSWLEKNGIDRIRLDFTTETEEEAVRIARAILSGDTSKISSFTRRHFKKGVM